MILLLFLFFKAFTGNLLYENILDFIKIKINILSSENISGFIKIKINILSSERIRGEPRCVVPRP